MEKKSSKNMKWELASQKKQKLVEPIQDIFLSKVLGIEGALVTDESYISDFIPFPRDHAIREGTNQGTMVFAQKIYVGPFVNPKTDWQLRRAEMQKPENWKNKEIEAEPGLSLSDVVEKTKKIFGVDVSTVSKKPLVDILLHIAENYKGRGK